VIAVRVIAHLLSRACATIAAGTQGLDTAARARLMPKTDAAPRAPATTHAREAAGTRHPSACQAPRPRRRAVRTVAAQPEGADR
jgi:hypothetical protein